MTRLDSDRASTCSAKSWEDPVKPWQSTRGGPDTSPHWPQCNSTPLTLMRSGPLTESDSVRVRHAQVVVLGDDDLARVGPTGRAGRVATDVEGAERLLEGVVGQ